MSQPVLIDSISSSAGQLPQVTAAGAVEIFVNGSLGSDSNPGTDALPVATIPAAEALLPPGGRGRCRIIIDNDGVGRTYTNPSAVAISPTTYKPVGPNGTSLVYECRGTPTVLAPSQAEGVGGSVRVLTGSFANTTLTDAPLAAGATAINVVSTTGFPSTGILKVDSEIIRYTGITATSFTGCTRGHCATRAVSHTVGASIFIFLAGYYLRLTAADTTVSDNPLTSGATTVNVASTAGYPSVAVIRIDNEWISYTGKTATSFTGCVRGVENSGPASHLLGAVVSLYPSRNQIKINTATTATVVADFPAAVAVGTTYVVDTPSTKIVINDLWGPQFLNFGIFGCIIDSSSPVLGLGLFPSYANVCLRFVNIISSTNVIPSNGCTLRDRFINELWLPDGVNNPFPGQFGSSQGFNGGVRWEGLAAAPFAIFRQSRMQLVRSVYVNMGLQIDTHGDATGLSFNMHGGAVYFTEQGCCRIGDASADANRMLLSGAPIIADGVSELRIQRCDVSNSLANNPFVPPTGAFPANDGSGIICRRGSLVRLTTSIGGTGNEGYGVENLDGNVTTLDTASTVTGALGDMRCGNRPPRTWADFNAVAPASGLPSRVEFDAPGFLSRPLKRSFAGLPAASSFDLSIIDATGETVASTTLASGTTAAATSIPVVALAGFPSTGMLLIDSEQILYAGIQNRSTALNLAMGIGDVTATVESTSLFPTTGLLLIDSEQITYAGITATTFTGLVRGVNGTAAATHLAAAAVASTNFTGLVRGSDGTTAAVHAAAAVVSSNPRRQALVNSSTLRVSAVGTAALGTRILGDAGDTASSSVALISDDGKTVTFEGTVTAFVIEYTPTSGNAQINANSGARNWQAA